MSAISAYKMLDTRSCRLYTGFNFEHRFGGQSRYAR
jgi:hypothetical protein